jgi:hypothetical protein
VILEFEFDAALFKLVLRAEKIFPVRAKSEMQHADIVAARWRFWTTAPLGKQRDGGISFGYECGNSVPHLFITSLESEDVHVPVRGLLHVAHSERHVINSFELHMQRDRLNCCVHGLVVPDDSMCADRTVEAFQGNFTDILK